MYNVWRLLSSPARVATVREGRSAVSQKLVMNSISTSCACRKRGPRKSRPKVPDPLVRLRLYVDGSRDAIVGASSFSAFTATICLQIASGPRWGVGADRALELEWERRGTTGSRAVKWGKIESAKARSGIRTRIAGLFSGKKASARAEAASQEIGVSDMEETEEGNTAVSQTTYYFSHGSPMLPLEDEPAKAFLQGFPRTLPEKPKAILMVSGHWDTKEPMVSTTAKNQTIYDFYGFPPELYRLTYTPPGAPAVGHRAIQLLKDAGFKVGEDKKRGLDHGAWVPLLLAYPEADIPVLQLSIQSHRNAEHHYKVGQALQPLKDEGVLIIGSGSAVHNLREVMRSYGDTSGKIQSWAKAFDDWTRESLVSGKFDDVVHYESRAPYAQKAHPSNDHFVPLLVALGAAGDGRKAVLIHASWSLSCMSYASYAFRPAPASL